MVITEGKTEHFQYSFSLNEDRNKLFLDCNNIDDHASLDENSIFCEIISLISSNFPKADYDQAVIKDLAKHLIGKKKTST